MKKRLFHSVVVRVMQRVFFRGEQFDRLADAARLVDRALFADRQMHRQVQKRIRLAAFNVVHGGQRSAGIGEVEVVLRVLVDPHARYCFQGIHGLQGLGFGMN